MMRKRKLSRSSSSDSVSSDITSEIDATSDSQKGKKHRKSYSFEEKNEILKALEIHSYQHVSEEYGIHVRMLRKWNKKRAEIEAATENKNLCKKKKKRLFTEELDKRLYNWFIESRDAGISLTGAIIKRQALTLNEELGGKEKFMASDCWLDNWKKRMKLKNNHENNPHEIEDASDDTHERKRRRKKYSTEQKVEMIRALETQSYQAVAQEYGVDEKLLYKWRKKKQKVEIPKDDENSETDDLHRRLHEWFVQTQLAPIPLAECSSEKQHKILNDETIASKSDPRVATTSLKRDMEQDEIQADNLMTEFKTIIPKKESISNETDFEFNAASYIERRKNPQENYSFAEKAEILRALEIRPLEHVSEKYGVEMNILRDWKDEEIKLKNATETLISFNRRKGYVTEEMHPKLHEWSTRAQLAALPSTEYFNDKKTDIPNDETVSTQIESKIHALSGLNETEKHRNSYSLEQKNIILNALKTKSYHLVSHEYGIDEKLLRQWKIGKCAMGNTTENQTPFIDDLHTRLHEWFVQTQLDETPDSESTSGNKPDHSNDGTTSTGIHSNINVKSYNKEVRNSRNNSPIEEEEESTDAPAVESILENKISPFKITISKKLYADNNEINNEEMRKHRKSYSFEQKNEILKVLHSQPHQYVCEEYGVGVGMLQKWKKQTATIEAATESPILCKKKRKKCVNEELDTRLYEWSIQAKNSGISITGPALKKQALILNAELGGRSNFKASEGWLDNWKKRTEELARLAEHPATDTSTSEKKMIPSEEKNAMHIDSESDATSDIEETKKHRKSYTFEQKNEILKALESQSSQSVSEEYGVHERMLSKWKKKKAEIVAAMENPALRKKKKRRIITDELDARLYEWSIRARLAGVSLTGRMLKQQALIFNKLFGGKTDFRASDGWLDGWKKRTEARLAGLSEMNPMFGKKAVMCNNENVSDTDKTKKSEMETDNVDLHTRLHEWSIQAQFPGIPATKPMMQSDDCKGTPNQIDSESDATSDIQEKKKHRNSYSFEEKAEILKLLETQPYQYVAEECGINIRVLRKWNKKRAEIEDAIQTHSLCRKRKKRASTEVLDALLYDWFTKAQRHGITVTGPTLKKQALILNKELGGKTKFRASDGWLDGWKKRKNVRFCSIAEDKKIR